MQVSAHGEIGVPHDPAGLQPDSQCVGDRRAAAAHITSADQFCRYVPVRSELRDVAERQLGCCLPAGRLLPDAFETDAKCEVGHRPGRLEPRVIKRRRHGYPLMQKPRGVLKRELRKHCT